MKKIIAFLMSVVMLAAYVPVSAGAVSDTYTVSQIINSAEYIVNYIGNNKQLPDSVSVNGETLDTASVGMLMLAATAELFENNSTAAEIEFYACEEAPSPKEKVSGTESITKEGYVDMAQKAYEFCKTNGRAPNHLTTPQNNRMCYQNMIYCYAKVLVFYKNYSRLPETLAHTSWAEFTGGSVSETSTPKPTATPNTKTYTIYQISVASISLVRSIQKDKKIPDKINVAGDDLTVGQYMNLAFRALVNIADGKNEDIHFFDAGNAPSPAGMETAYEFAFDDYVAVAKYSIAFIEKNARIANYFTGEHGRIGVNEAIYAYARILAAYATDGALLDSVHIVPWNMFAVETETVEKEVRTYDYSKTLLAAQRLYAAVAENRKMPVSMSINGYKLYMAELLSLFADTLIDIEYGVDDSNMLFALSPSKSSESLSAGKLSKNEYLTLASDTLDYIEAEGKAPENMLTRLGSISFENLVYTFAGIIIASEKGLPLNYTVKTWESITGEKLPLPEFEATYTPVPTFVPNSGNTDRSRNEKTASIQEISTAAKRFIFIAENAKKLPSTVNVGVKNVALPEFLMLMMNAVLYINGNVPVAVEYIAADEPESDGETIKNGTVLKKAEIADIAKKALEYTRNTRLAPSYIMTTGGAMGYKTALYFFASILKDMALPASQTVRTWESLTGMTALTPAPTMPMTATPAPTPYNGVGVMEGDAYGTSAIGENGAVSSSSKYASKIGLDILKAGGNAIDAAVATIFAVGLCEPSGSSLGGGGITVIYLADEDKYITMDYMVGGTGSGPAGVPGIPLGAVTMLEKYGTMTLQEILAPVIKLANDGFAVTETFCKKSKLVGNSEGTYLNTLFRKDGEYFTEGDIFKNEDLGHVLKMISDNGIEYFYDSDFTDELCAYLQTKGCTITRSDFASYEVFQDEPRVGDYRGYTIYAGSGTATGGASVLSMLDKMESYDISLLGHDHSETVRITASAFGIRPSNGSLNEKFGLSIDEMTDDVEWFDTKSTTMLVTRDKYGNMVASNNTLGANFGSEIAMPGTGFCMSSRNCAVGDRVSSTMAPCIVAWNDGTPMLGVGSPGNSAIITATAITISNILDFDMTVAEAIHAPRLYGSNSTITIEGRYSPWVYDDLKKMGYTLNDYQNDFSDGVGCVSAIYIDEDGTVYSSADIRREYMSYAY